MRYYKQLSKRFSMKTMGTLLFLCLSLVLIVGCTAEKVDDKGGESSKSLNEAAIQAVLEKEFTGPDEEYLRLEEAVEEKVKDLSEEERQSFPELEDLRAYVREMYVPYFTDSGLDSFINAFHHPMVDKISIDHIEVVQSENENAPKNYSYTAQVEYEENDGDSTILEIFEISGTAICSEEGRIGKIVIDDGGLSQRRNGIVN